VTEDLPMLEQKYGFDTCLSVMNKKQEKFDFLWFPQAFLVFSLSPKRRGMNRSVSWQYFSYAYFAEGFYING